VNVPAGARSLLDCSHQLMSTPPYLHSSCSPCFLSSPQNGLRGLHHTVIFEDHIKYADLDGETLSPGIYTAAALRTGKSTCGSFFGFNQLFMSYCSLTMSISLLPSCCRHSQFIHLCFCRYWRSSGFQCTSSICCMS
jgi:hypothetical protein